MSRTIQIYILAAISFLIGTAEYAIAGILDYISTDLKISVAAAGQFITIFSIAFGIGTPLIITFTSQLNRKNLLLYATLVFALSNIAIAFFSSYLMINIFRAISGLSAGVLEVVCLTIAAAISPPEKKGSAIATIVMGFSIALVAGVPLGRLLLKYIDWEIIYLVIGLLSFLLFFIISKNISKIDNNEKGLPLSQQFKFFKNPLIATTFLITLFWINAYSIIYSYISPFLLDVSKMTDSNISLILFFCGISSIFGSKIGGFLTDKYGSQLTLFLGLTLQSLMLLSISFFNISLFLIFLLLIIWTLSAWSSGPALQFNLIKLAPLSTSIMFSLYASILQLGMALGAMLGGIVIQKSNIEYIPWVAESSILIAILLMSIFYIKKDKV
ncbi:MFS transporter [Acinetobacter pittii]|uniref:MFS transporter n=1 Tax=Acinetobacter pittii TaxID=48296 RepID=UPI002952B862|nr:MFS transporter [Acinetobacter pittii]MDV8153904.1 MFS transporter [Acinetobacter pittii]